jgi:glycine/serine hydroxymethyltransferase
MLFYFNKAIAVALKDCCTDDFKQYAKQTVENSKAMCKELMDRGYKVVTGLYYFKHLIL